MYTWTSFQKSLSALQSIENHYHEYVSIQSQAELFEDVIPIEHERYQRLANRLKRKIFVEVAKIQKPVYFWHFPFYTGDFLGLGKALALAGSPIEMSRSTEVRDRFRQFLRSAPESAQKNISGAMSSPRRQYFSTALLRKLAFRRQSLAESVLNN